MAMLEWARSLRAASLMAIAACSVEPRNNLLGPSPASRDPSTPASATGQAASKARIEIWVSAADAAKYTAIDPAKTGSGATLPVGAAGYNPDVGDYYGMVTDPRGVVLNEPDGGGPMQGRMPECHSCHLPRAEDDFLFGVPTASRSAGP